MSWIPSLVTGFIGYKGAKDQAAQQAANNALLKEQYEYEKSVRAPAVTGAQDVLAGGNWIKDGKVVPKGTAGATWQSQFQPFVDAQGQQAVGASNIASQYLANVPHYQQAGLAGLAGYQNLAQMTPEQQAQLQNQYASSDIAAQYRLAADDINRDATAGQRARASRGGRFAALSSQAARQAGQIERQRQDAILQAAANASQQGYNRAQSELQRRQGLAANLTALGSSGLSQAQSAASLGSTAAQQGIAAPFQPFNQYSAAIGNAPTANAPQYQITTDPFTTGAGLGLQAWNTFNNQNK